tara:strand:+ start:15520 stop:15732 length:213 start_codon:yes stop_codon:yes gene_type:complete
MQVKLKKFETSEQLIKRFVRKSKKEGIVEQCLDRQFYKKPSEKRREAKESSIAKQKKEVRKERLLEKRNQ